MEAIHRCKTHCISTQMDAMGIESSLWMRFTIILKNVSHFYETEIGGSPCTTLVTNGDVSHINTPYEEFDAIMTQFLKDQEEKK